MKTHEEFTPVMSVNPYNDKMMNVEPFFRTATKDYEIPECQLFTDQAIKFLALSQLPEWADLEEKGEVVLFLYRLREMFESLSQCEISLPKKK